MNNKETFEERQRVQDEVLAYWNEPKKEQQNMIKVLEDNSAVFAASIHRISAATGHTYKEASDVASLFAKQGMSFHKVLELTESALHCIAATPTLVNMDQIKRDVDAFQALKAISSIETDKSERDKYVWQYGQLDSIDRASPHPLGHPLTFAQLRALFQC